MTMQFNSRIFTYASFAFGVWIGLIAILIFFVMYFEPAGNRIPDFIALPLHPVEWVFQKFLWAQPGSPELVEVCMLSPEKCDSTAMAILRLVLSGCVWMLCGAMISILRKRA